MVGIAIIGCATVGRIGVWIDATTVAGDWGLAGAGIDASTVRTGFGIGLANLASVGAGASTTCGCTTVHLIVERVNALVATLDLVGWTGQHTRAGNALVIRVADGAAHASIVGAAVLLVGLWVNAFVAALDLGTCSDTNARLAGFAVDALLTTTAGIVDAAEVVVARWINAGIAAKNLWIKTLGF